MTKEQFTTALETVYGKCSQEMIDRCWKKFYYQGREAFFASYTLAAKNPILFSK